MYIGTYIPSYILHIHNYITTYIPQYTQILLIYYILVHKEVHKSIYLLTYISVHSHIYIPTYILRCTCLQPYIHIYFRLHEIFFNIHMFKNFCLFPHIHTMYKHFSVQKIYTDIIWEIYHSL